jgi:hypothetical protein
VLEFVSLLVHLLDHLLFERRLRPRVRNLARRLRYLRRPIDLTPEALPPGTPGATAAGNPAFWPPVPQFVTANNSSWMLQEFTRQQQAALRAAVNDPSMWRNAALLDSPQG